MFVFVAIITKRLVYLIKSDQSSVWDAVCKWWWKYNKKKNERKEDSSSVYIYKSITFQLKATLRRQPHDIYLFICCVSFFFLFCSGIKRQLNFKDNNLCIYCDFVYNFTSIPFRFRFRVKRAKSELFFFFFNNKNELSIDFELFVCSPERKSLKWNWNIDSISMWMNQKIVSIFILKFRFSA